MASKRDYKTEYQRRIANAEKQGRSRSQARGHARSGEAPASAKSKIGGAKFEAALKIYRDTGNQTTAAKAVGIAPERLRRFLRETVQVSGRGPSLKITDNRPREMTVISDGEIRHLTLRDFNQASLNGRHQSAVKTFLNSSKIGLLQPFEGATVIDVKGQSYLLETDPNILHRLAAAGSEVFHEVYRLIQ